VLIVRPADLFTEHFGEATGAMVARAPGRVNLIGEHTDCNDGFVLPVTIDRSLEVVARRRLDRQVRLVAADLEESFETDLDAPFPEGGPRWLAYTHGVVLALAHSGRIDRGVDLVFRGTVPRGAGLGSSAALEVAVATALDGVFKLWLGGIETASICRDVEHEFAGVRCGIMDQFAARLGRPGYALLINCRNLEARHIPIRIEDAGFAVVDTGVRRELANSPYNQRRRECDEAVAEIHRLEPGVVSLRDVTPDLLDTCRGSLSPTLLARCRHVVNENQRVLAACKRLADGDARGFGRLMDASHDSLRDDFEVSHPALDRVVDTARRIEGVYGSRLTGAGFGGCTVHLVANPSRGAFDALMRPVLDELRGSSILWIGKPEPAGVKEIIA
jgi:galactokinase